ncbi:helix-turn-helix domain-containing protein [Clostridium sp. MT-14]|uniref:helix-turn-helix domain-containing protein n=1 Tax=Clostridium sp. MT-14 TaxID=3348360 RepID=UPI0035F3D7C4
MSVSINLKKLRIEKGLTQEELSKNLNINRATYAHYETGRREPDIETLRLLAKYFNVSVDYLLDTTDRTENATLGDRIRILREEKSISQLELAKTLNIANTTLSQYESGKRIPSDSIKKKIAEYFNVSLDYLMGLTDSKTNNPRPKLSEKDERDIKKDLNKTLEQLENSQDGLMFDGEPMDDETRELLRISLENSMRIAKQAAKKYTPKKYRK